MMVLLLVGSIGALAAAGIYLAENAAMMSRAVDRERELRYAADNALQMGKSRMNINPAILPDTGFDTLSLRQPIYDASNQMIPGVLVSSYLGATGDASGQSGILNATLLVEARTHNDVGFVRALEVTQESFAKYAYWSNRESPDNNTIYFGGRDQLWGPVWSNDDIAILSGSPSPQATFHDNVSTAGTISNAGNALFKKGYKTRQPRIELPSNRTLSRLQGYASAGGFAFTSVGSTGNETTVRTRIEFVAADLNADGDSTDADEGLFRVFRLNAGSTPANLRGDWQGTTLQNVTQCGDWHDELVGGQVRTLFFPAAVHATPWFRQKYRTTFRNFTFAQDTAGSNLSVANILSHPNARCFPAGAPQLAAVERSTGTISNTSFTPGFGYTAAQAQVGGSDTTFTPTGRYGAWTLASSTPVAPLAARFTANNMENYFYAAYRGLNPGARGVIYTAGTVAVSGVLRGRITLYAENGTVVFIDDLRYAKDPSIINPDPSKQCEESDILGVIAGGDIVVADNAINTPQNPGTGNRYLDDSPKEVWIHGVVMALDMSFKAQNHTLGSTNSADCQGAANGRGCLYLHGGVIQEARGAVGLGDGHGFTKRYSYDKCAADSPPPYFPTTGRFLDNEYTEVEPVNFRASEFYRLRKSGS